MQEKLVTFPEAVATDTCFGLAAVSSSPTLDVPNVYVLDLRVIFSYQNPKYPGARCMCHHSDAVVVSS